MRVDLGGVRSPGGVRLPALLGQECARGTRLANWADGGVVSHYRAPPAALPSERLILSPAAREGILLSCESTDADVDRAASDGREDDARTRAAAAPCPAFRPLGGVTVGGAPKPRALTRGRFLFAPGRPIFG